MKVVMCYSVELKNDWLWSWRLRLHLRAFTPRAKRYRYLIKPPLGNQAFKIYWNVMILVFPGAVVLLYKYKFRKPNFLGLAARNQFSFSISMFVPVSYSATRVNRLELSVITCSLASMSFTYSECQRISSVSVVKCGNPNAHWSAPSVMEDKSSVDQLKDILNALYTPLTPVLQNCCACVFSKATLWNLLLLPTRATTSEALRLCYTVKSGNSFKLWFECTLCAIFWKIWHHWRFTWIHLSRILAKYLKVHLFWKLKRAVLIIWHDISSCFNCAV